MTPPLLKIVKDNEKSTAHTSGGGGGYTLDERVLILETTLKNLATKEDIQKIKVWVLLGVIAGFVLASGFISDLFAYLASSHSQSP